MDMMLNETSEELDKLVQYLDSKIINFRSDEKYRSYVHIIKEFYTSVVIPLYESRIDNSNTELLKVEEQKIVNKILDFINLLNKVF